MLYKKHLSISLDKTYLEFPVTNVGSANLARA